MFLFWRRFFLVCFRNIAGAHGIFYCVRRCLKKQEKLVKQCAVLPTVNIWWTEMWSWAERKNLCCSRRRWSGMSEVAPEAENTRTQRTPCLLDCLLPSSRLFQLSIFGLGWGPIRPNHSNRLSDPSDRFELTIWLQPKRRSNSSHTNRTGCSV